MYSIIPYREYMEQWVKDWVKKQRRLVSYHLLTLEEHGFLSSKYEISEQPKSKGKAIRKYEVTEKVGEVILKLKMSI